MAKKQPQAAAPAVAPSVPAYVIGPRGARYAGHNNTKHGQGGTAATWAAVLAALQANGGTITAAQLVQVTAEAGDKGFARYSLRNNWLVPQA